MNKRKYTLNPLKWFVCLLVRAPAIILLGLVTYIGEVAEAVSHFINPFLPDLTPTKWPAKATVRAFFRRHTFIRRVVITVTLCGVPLLLIYDASVAIPRALRDYFGEVGEYVRDCW